MDTIRKKQILVKELGYGERYLDRYKYEDEVSELFRDKYSEWIKNNSKAKSKSAVEETKLEPVKPKQKVVDKETGEMTVGETVPNKIYHESDNLSASKVKMILGNAVQFRDMYVTKTAKKINTDALLVGSLHHTLVLEPENFDNDYMVLEFDSRPLKNDLVEVVEKLGGKIWRKENDKGDMVVTETMSMLREMLNELMTREKRTIVTKKQLELAQKTSVKALESWYVIEKNGKTLLKAQLKDVLELDNSHVERSFYGEIGDVKFQVRPDLLMNLGKAEPIWFCVDLKTAADATMEMFSKQSARFYYDLQEWIYCEILRQNGINVVDFRFCVAGKAESSRCAYYQMDKEDIGDAEKIARRAILKYAFCFNNDIWEESRFDFEKMKFDSCSVVKLPTYRKFQLIDMGVL
jgi:hypothetical protein